MSGTDRKCGANTEGRNSDGTFAAGNSGKPPGTRHRTTVAILSLLDGQAEALSQKAIDLALEGDTVALRLCLERIAPPRKDAPIVFDLPPMKSAEDAAEAAGAVLDAVAQGQVTPLEGSHLMGLVENFRRCLETSDIEKRLTELENKT